MSGRVTFTIQGGNLEHSSSECSVWCCTCGALAEQIARTEAAAQMGNGTSSPREK